MPKKPKPPSPTDRPKSPRFKSKKQGAPGSHGTAEPTLRDLSRQFPDHTDFLEIAEDLEKAGDRSAAIVMASAVERYLEKALIESLPRNDAKSAKGLTERGGALDGFYAKIYLGYALRLYNEQKLSELEAIRQIRNAFAHSAKPISFETKQIADTCSAFKLLRRLPETTTPRERYISACTRMLGIFSCHIAVAMLKRSNLLKKIGDAELIQDFAELEVYLQILGADAKTIAQ